ncbi:MAG: hypothetical protein OEW39_01245 [Deltaproteobacteria bacterium]|nr:hypothetical protein [Deltaproteobacteria bacterium]
MVLTLAGILLAAPAGWAQTAKPAEAQANDPPQILTADLTREMTAVSESQVVSFVFIDTEPIVKILINGEAQQFEPADTVLLEQTFTFDQPKTLVEVIATDASGNTHRKTYLVYKPGTTRETEGYIRTFVTFRTRFEADSNPIFDLSFPFSQIYTYPVQAPDAVPDKEQKDIRSSVEMLGGGTYDNYTMYGGLRSILYRKPKNQGLESNVYFIGGSYQFVFERSFFNALSLEYMLMDINLAGYDYSRNNALSAVLIKARKDKKGSAQHKFALDLQHKDFSRPSQTDGMTPGMRWIFNSNDPEQMDRYTSELAVGTSSEGYDLTDYKYITSTFDWNLRWENNVKLETGFGVGFRDYPNEKPLAAQTFLGKKRRDMPGQFNIRTGYLFLKKITALLSYSYEYSFSNKNPYKRSLYGVIVQGTF